MKTQEIRDITWFRSLTLIPTDTGLLIMWSSNPQRRWYFPKKAENQVWELWPRVNLQLKTRGIRICKLTPHDQYTLISQFVCFFHSKEHVCFKQNKIILSIWRLPKFAARKTIYSLKIINSNELILCCKLLGFQLTQA
jgi:hypothetical protein